MLNSEKLAVSNYLGAIKSAGMLRGMRGMMGQAGRALEGTAARAYQSVPHPGMPRAGFQSPFRTGNSVGRDAFNSTQHPLYGQGVARDAFMAQAPTHPTYNSGVLRDHYLAGQAANPYNFE